MQCQVVSAHQQDQPASQVPRSPGLVALQSPATSHAQVLLKCMDSHPTLVTTRDTCIGDMSDHIICLLKPQECCMLGGLVTPGRCLALVCGCQVMTGLQAIVCPCQQNGSIAVAHASTQTSVPISNCMKTGLSGVAGCKLPLCNSSRRNWVIRH